MNIQQAIKSMMLAFTADMTLVLKGPPGVGKTSIGHQYAAQQGTPETYGLCELNAATANLADIMGYLLPHDQVYTDVNGKEHVVKEGKYTYPFWMRDKRTRLPAFCYERGLLIIEEWGQATADVKRGLASVIEEKRIGEHYLPAGWSILVCTNREEDRSGVGKNFDFLINRWNEVTIDPEFKPWEKWANANGVNSLVIAFAAQNPDIVFAAKVPDKQGPWCTPRSAVKAGRLITAALAQGMAIDDPVLHMNLCGTVGDGAAAQLMANIKLGASLPKYEEIIKEPTKTKVPTAVDAQMIVTYSLAGRAEEKDYGAVATYMKRLPEAFGVTFVSALFHRDQKAVFNGEIAKWMADNTDILRMVRA